MIFFFQSDPIPGLFWVVGFNFARAEVIREVPYDPNLPLEKKYS
jgi:hypothetical protein